MVVREPITRDFADKRPGSEGKSARLGVATEAPGGNSSAAAQTYNAPLSSGLKVGADGGQYRSTGPQAVHPVALPYRFRLGGLGLDPEAP